MKINDINILKDIKNICYDGNDVRAAWCGIGYPETDIEEYRGFCNWAIEHLKMYEGFLDEIIKNGSIKMLDVGCGSGMASLFLSEKFFNSYIISIDSNEKCINFANKYNNHERIQYLCQNIFSFSRAEKYDYIFALEILEHIKSERHYEFIDKLLDMLEEDGLLFLTTPNENNPDEDNGHIGILNFSRQTPFFERYAKKICRREFYNNKKLLFEKSIEINNGSHFKLTFKKEV